MEKSLSLFLSLILILGVITSLPVTANAAANSSAQVVVNNICNTSGFRPNIDNYSDCYAYASAFCNKMYGSAPGGVSGYNLTRPGNFYLVGQTYGTGVTETSVASLLSQAMPGDVVQMYWLYDVTNYKHGPHTAIVYSADSTSFTILQDGASFNTIKKSTYAYSSYYTRWRGSGFGISLYRHSNYNNLFPEYTAPPTEAWIWSDKTNVAVGEAVRLNYNAKNATNFVLGIWHNGNHSIVDVGVNDWHTMTFSEAGVYAIHAACYNPKGYMDSYEIYIYVYDNVPTNATISSDKSCVQVGGDVTFNFGADNAINYVVGIYDYKTDPVIADVGTAKSFTYNFANKGTYYVHAACYNSYGHTDTYEIEITVYDTAPSAPEKIHSDKTLYSSEEFITFTWSKVKNASEYWVYLWKDGVELYGTNMGNNTIFTSAPTSPGNYTLIVRAGNAYGYSNEPCSFDFTVYDPNQEYTITYNANGGTDAPSAQTKTYGQALTLSSTKPTRLGYMFCGWATSNNATEATYSAGDSFTTDADTTLYAVWEEAIKETANVRVDYNNFMIYTDIQKCSDVSALLDFPDNLDVTIAASQNLDVFGTGTMIVIYDEATYIGAFNFIVNGDTNGDSVCDVLDCAQVERVSSGNDSLYGVFAEAGDINGDDVIDITDYQSIVNKAIL